MSVNKAWRTAGIATIAGLIFVAAPLSAQTVTATVSAGGPGVAVNPVTNQIFVADISQNMVTVIDGATNLTALQLTGRGPRGVAVNTVTNQNLPGQRDQQRRDGG